MFNPFNSPQPAAARLSMADAIEQVARGDMALIDVRDISEVRISGKAKDALHIPLMLLNSKADPRSPECESSLDTAKPVGLYCATGARSHLAAQMLSKMGYQAVFNLGGLYDWASAGGQVEPI